MVANFFEVVVDGETGDTQETVRNFVFGHNM